MGYNSPLMRRAATFILGSALAGSQLSDSANQQHAA
jgi:hypothetical protein